MGEDLLIRRGFSPMDQLLTKEESYVQRRQLFKNIWETAMHIDEKETDIMKTKVIKTLRMDEIDKCPIGKPKKQKIKNLRHVCNRILDFCNRQEADDTHYELQLASGGNIPTPPIKTAVKLRKHKLKVKPKCMFTAPNITVERLYTDANDTSAKVKTEGSSTSKRKVKPKKYKSIKIREYNEITGELLPHRKVIKKKRFKRKSTPAVSPIA